MKARGYTTIALAASCGFVLASLASCSATRQEDRATLPGGNIGTPLHVANPLGLPPVPFPSGNPITADKVALGRALFYDARLSADNTISCASCHKPTVAFADAVPLSAGVHGTAGARNAISVLNAAYQPAQFWDGRSATLESQSAVPMEDAKEMNQPINVAVQKLAQDPAMQKKFDAAFGPGPITVEKIQQAIASFERTLVSGNSPFDRYQFGHDKTAMSPAAIRGLEIFQDPNKGNCSSCHTIDSHYALFSDGQFHNTGEGVDGEGNLTDAGRYTVTKVDADRGAFMTPSLRSVAETAPYMHDGKLKTLDAVVQFYAGGGNTNPYLDKKMKPLPLTARDRADLVEFLKSLSGELPAAAGPPEPTR